MVFSSFGLSPDMFEDRCSLITSIISNVFDGINADVFEISKLKALDQR